MSMKHYEVGKIYTGSSEGFGKDGGGLLFGFNGPDRRGLVHLKGEELRKFFEEYGLEDSGNP